MICHLSTFPIDSSLNNYGSLLSQAWKIISRNFIELGLYLFTGAAPLFTPIATYMISQIELNPFCSRKKELISSMCNVRSVPAIFIFEINIVTS